MKHSLRTVTALVLSVFLLTIATPCIGTVYAGAIPQIDLDSIRTDTVEYVPNVGNSCSAAGSPTAAAGSSVYILGDSITVRTTPDYKTGFQAKGLSTTVSARVGRSWVSGGQDEGDNVGTQGPAKTAVDTDADAIKTAGSIVIALGTNGFAGGNPIDEIYTKIHTLNPTATIWWVNVADVTTINPGVVDFNTKLDQAAPGKFTVIPWSKTVDPTGDGTHDPNGTLQDGTHPFVGTGTKLLSDLVVGAVTGSATTSSPTPTPATAGGCSCPSGSTTNIPGADNAEKAFNFFLSNGFSALQAAGILGNAQIESTFRTDAVEPPPGTGYGIFQWSFGRHTALFDAAKAANKDVNDLGFQLDFTMNEIKTRDAINPAGGKEIDGLKKITDIKEAVLFWEHNFERSKDTDANPDTNIGLKDRIGAGVNLLTKFGSGAPGSPGGSNNTSCAGAASKSTSTTFNYEDTSRSRKLKTVVYTPTGAGPFPVVMFAHGWEKGPDAYKRYIQAIADKGFVVVAPSFPNADEHGILPLNRDDSLPKQPADIKFVLDQILKEPALQGKIKTDSIAMVGHSDGAIDALMVGYSDQKDTRFKAVVSVGSDDISGQLSSGPPLLMMHGEKDTIAKPDGDLNNFKKITATPKHFYTMLGGDHGVPGSWVDAGSDDTPALDALTTGFLDMELNGKPDTLKAIGDQFSGKVKEEQ